jgi:uncharacterized protein (DUF302 family)
MYSFSTQLSGSLEEVEGKVVEALKQQGFGVLTEIDVKATMQKKLGIDRAPYKILGACNPVLANKAIDAEPDIGLLLPCNVVLREDAPNQVTVAFMNPKAVMTLVDHSDVVAVADEADLRLRSVMEALQQD